MPHRRRPATSPLRSHLPKLALALGLVALALGAAAVRPAPAQAATPCWKLLLNDWYDGRIDQTYPVHCYKDALKHLPADVQTYSSAHDDILRALQTAIAKQKKSAQAGQRQHARPAAAAAAAAARAAAPAAARAATEHDHDDRRRQPGQRRARRHRSSADDPSSIPRRCWSSAASRCCSSPRARAGLIAKRIQARRRPRTP